MNIPKAIEELRDSLDESIPTLREDRRNALKLGIEALKQLGDWRKGGVLGLDEPLPSETK